LKILIAVGSAPEGFWFGGEVFGVYFVQLFLRECINKRFFKIGIEKASEI